MKLLCVFALIVCAVAHGANVIDESSGIESVTKNLERSQYELRVVSKDFEESENIPSELQIENEEAIDTRIISGAIGQLLEQLRDVVINGNDDLPPLDPLVISTLGPFQYSATGITAEININNLRMEGLRWFVADRITVNPLRLTVGMTITVPWLTITGNYDARARLALLSHTAGGNIRIFAHRIEVSVDMRMGTNIFGGGHLTLRELDIHIDIHDTQISITGMTGSSVLNSLISSTIQNLTQDVIQSQLEEVSRLLSEELFDTVNEILKDYTISDIFG